jgi:hypothetical protein
MPANTFEELEAEWRTGVESATAIFAQEGHYCLLRREYQFDDNELSFGTPFLHQNSDLSPYDPPPPPSSESPDSILSQDGSGVSSGARLLDGSGDYSHIHLLKKFKCHHSGCPYAADRQDHTRDHYKAHHEGNYYVCDVWYAFDLLFSILDIDLRVLVTRSMFTRETLPPIRHATNKSRSSILNVHSGVWYLPPF